MMTLNEVTQRRLERYQEHLLEAGKAVKAAAAFNRVVLESAAFAGIAEGLPADLGDLSPRAVADMTQAVLAHIEAAVKPLSGEA